MTAGAEQEHSLLDPVAVISGFSSLTSSYAQVYIQTHVMFFSRMGDTRACETRPLP